MRISIAPKLRVHAHLRIDAQEGPTEGPSQWGDLIDPDVIPPEKQKLVEAPAPEQVQTKRQRDTRVRKLQQLIEDISPIAEQGGVQGEEAQNLITQLQNQMESINQLNQVGSDYFNWLQEQPSQLSTKEWAPGKKWKTPEEIPVDGPPTSAWEGPETPAEAPRFPPTQQAPKPKMMETAPQQPMDLSQEQLDQETSGLQKQMTLEQKALELDRFLDSVEQRAGQVLSKIRVAPEDEIESVFKRELTQLVNKLDGEIAQVRPLADALLAQIGGAEQTSAQAPTPDEPVDTTDFEKYFPDQG